MSDHKTEHSKAFLQLAILIPFAALRRGDRSSSTSPLRKDWFLHGRKSDVNTV